MKLKSIPWFSSKEFTLEEFPTLVFTGCSQPGLMDSRQRGPNLREMQIQCVKGTLRGAKVWIDWETEVTLLEKVETHG